MIGNAQLTRDVVRHRLKSHYAEAFSRRTHKKPPVLFLLTNRCTVVRK